MYRKTGKKEDRAKIIFFLLNALCFSVINKYAAKIKTSIAAVYFIKNAKPKSSPGNIKYFGDLFL